MAIRNLNAQTDILSALSYEQPSAIGSSPSAQMQYTASIPIAHHSPFSLCLLLLSLLAVATYSEYFILTSVHTCLSRSSGVHCLQHCLQIRGDGKSTPRRAPVGARQCCAALHSTAIPQYAIRCGAVRSEPPAVLRILRLNIIRHYN